MRNVPGTVASVICAGLASMRDLQEFHSVRDLYNMLEIAVIRSENERRAYKQAQAQQ